MIVAYVLSTLHTLISPQQLLNVGCTIIFDQLHSFQFFLDDQLQLLSYRSGNLFYFNITFSPTPTCTSPLTTLSTFSPQLCMDLIHHHLSHTSEAHCQESIQQSTNFSNQEKHKILSSSITPLCSICLAGKPTIHGMSHQPHTNHAPHGDHPGNLISLNLVSPMHHQSTGRHIYLLTITNSFSRMHFVQPLPNKSSTTISSALQNIVASFPSSVHIHHIQLDNTKELNAHISKWIAEVSRCQGCQPLLYIALVTCPDILHAVVYLS
jgi:hypothetical protein